MLCHRSARRPVKRFGRHAERTGEGYLSAPTPRPPMALPIVICVNECAHVCNADPMQKTTSSGRSAPEFAITWATQYTPHAAVMDDRLETLSASTPAPSAPNRHPSSSTAAIFQSKKGRPKRRGGKKAHSSARAPTVPQASAPQSPP